MWLKRLFTATIVLLWVGLISFAYWRMELRFLTPVDRPAGAAALDPATRPLAPRLHLTTDQGERSLQGKLTLLNFWSPDCACSRFMEPHVRELVQQFRPRGVQCITVIVPTGGRESETELLRRWYQRGIETPAVVDGDGALSRAFGVWAAPAAVIIEPQGRIAYLGAYNIGRFCNNEETAFAKRALEALLAGQLPPRAKTPFYGCQAPPAL